MSGPGQQGGTPGGVGGGGNNPNQVATPSGQADPTATGFVTSTSASPQTGTSAASPSTSASSSGVQKGAVIGGIIGGLAGLLIISLLGVWLLQRRKQRRNGAKTRSITYTGLNSVFRGVPFNRSSSQGPHDSLLPQPEVSHRTNASLPGVALRGGGTILGQRDSGNEMHNLPPSYAESQLRMSMASLGPLSTADHTHSDTIVSPLSSRDPNEAHTISPQTTGRTFMSSYRPSAAAEPHMISPQTTNPTIMASQYTGNMEEPYIISPQTTGASILLPQHTRDTMGFPVERDFEEFRPHLETPLPIVAPVPRHPIMHQDSLELVVRQGLMPSESPVPSNTNPDRLRVLSQEMPRESPVLGDMHPVRMMPPAALNNGLGRNNTQRTVSTVSSMGIDMVSDGELERLGVGSRARYH